MRHGPCEKSYEPVLQAHNIKRQAWHGGAFVGNHIHRALQPKVLAAITRAPLKIVQQRCPSLLSVAEVVSARYENAFSQYASCREVFSSSGPASEKVVATVDGRIKLFMSTARREIVDRKLGNITPKLHLLERHVVAQMRHFGTGLGLIGEHGAESIHAEFNSLAATFDAVPKELDRLAVIVKQHCISALPLHLAQVPERRTRKRTPRDRDD